MPREGYAARIQRGDESGEPRQARGLSSSEDTIWQVVLKYVTHADLGIQGGVHGLGDQHGSRKYRVWRR
jgi:hypothetical protein